MHPVIDGLGTRSAKTVVPAPGEGPGYWAGGPSALWRDGAVWLAYRLRRPVDAGRGFANVIARSTDGYTFDSVAEVTSAQFDSASLERPALVSGPDGLWRLFVSCSTAESKHWWVEMLEAPSPEAFGSGRGRVVLPGDERTAWKDPVVQADERGWRMWACRHDITFPDDADRMYSWYGTSVDGRDWSLHGPALSPTPASWDQRGVRITAVIPGLAGGAAPWLALYDGRASAAENWLERTGVAAGSQPDQFQPARSEPLVQSPSLRYISPVQLPDESWLVYYELERPDGAHDLRVEYVPRPTGLSQS